MPVTSWKGRIIGAVGGLAILAGGVATTMPVITAHAACGGTVGSGVGLDPIISQSDFLATPSNSYTWAGVSCFTTAAATAPDGGAEVAVTATLAAPIPSFPTARGDIGFTLTACADMSGTIASAPEQIGVGHRGQPVFDGPYPPEDGYKWCTDVVVQAGTPIDYGVEIFNPNGNFFFTDYPSLVTTSGTATITAPTGMATGSTSVTLYLPKTFSFHVNPPAPPLQGTPRTFVEPMISGSSSNVFVLTQVNAEATLPFPVCVNLTPPGISCNGNQIVGPIFGIVGLLVTSGWAPGSIQCGLLPGGLPNPLTCSVLPGANAVDLGILPLPPNAQAISTPCVDPLDSPIVDCATEGPTLTPYFPCQSTNTPGGQDVGDLYAVTTGLNPALPCPVAGPVSLPSAYVSQFGLIWPGEPQIPRVDGFTIGPAFLPSGVTGA
jgi:hypothetical protein